MDIQKILKVLSTVELDSATLDFLKKMISDSEIIGKENGNLKEENIKLKNEIQKLSSIDRDIEKLKDDKAEFEEKKKFREKDKEILLLKKDVECSERLVKQGNMYTEFVFSKKLISKYENGNSYSEMESGRFLSY